MPRSVRPMLLGQKLKKGKRKEKNESKRGKNDEKKGNENKCVKYMEKRRRNKWSVSGKVYQ
jgi:hypothetical protein